MTGRRIAQMTWLSTISLLLAVRGGPVCLGQAPDSVAPGSPFAPAIEGQKRALAEIASIIQQEKVMLSEGAVQLELERLLGDEQKQYERVVALLARIAGRRAEELSGQDRSDRDQLADTQEVCTDRYRRLEKGIEANAAAKPDSVYARLLALATEARLAQTLGEAAKQIRGNQLGNASRSTKKAVDALREMIALVTQKAAAPAPEPDPAAPMRVSLPSMLAKRAGDKLAQYDWLGTQTDPLGFILGALHKLKELAERQHKAAAAVESQASARQTAPDLAAEENDIRRQALELGDKLALLDPRIDRLIRTATGSIEQALPGMEKGPLAGAVEPSARAAEELQAAADYLDKLWKDILARLKQFTQEAQVSSQNAAGAVPHGLSKELMERLQKLVMVMLRATTALARAIEAQNGLIERTAAAGADLPSLKPEEEAVVQVITQEVLPFHDSVRQLPGQLAAMAEPQNLTTAVEFLKDGAVSAARAAVAFGKPDRNDALKNQKQSLEAMTHALDLMVRSLQRLLGQLAPTSITPGGKGAAGIALDPTGGGREAAGWLFDLPSQQQDSVRQAFLESFPRRYEQAIKLYYQVIAQEKESTPAR